MMKLKLVKNLINEAASHTLDMARRYEVFLGAPPSLRLCFCGQVFDRLKLYQCWVPHPRRAFVFAPRVG